MITENKGTILNLDDDPDFNRVLKVILKREGYQLISTTTAEEFAVKVKTEKPDLLLIDVNLDRGMGAGFTFVQAIRNKLGVELPVFVVSRRTAREDISRALELGANDFIPKPIDDTYLIQKISQYLHKKEIKPLPYAKISEKDWNCEFSYDLEVAILSEFGITLRGPHFLSKGTYLEVSGNLIGDINADKLKLTVNNSWMDEETRNYMAFCEFDSRDENLMAGVRSYILKNTPDPNPA